MWWNSTQITLPRLIIDNLSESESALHIWWTKKGFFCSKKKQQKKNNMQHKQKENKR